MKDYILIDKATGEVVSENYQAEELEDIERKQKAIEIRKSQDEFCQLIDSHCGNFYFLFYKLLNMNLEKQYITRFIYLCTFMNYENKLVFGNCKDYEYKLLKERELKEVWKMERVETNKTKNALLDSGLIYIENDHVNINSNYVFKGKLDGAKLKTDQKVRVFNNAVQQIYESATPREHKKIALLFLLLPYINLRYNIVCENPECEAMEDIIPITLQEMTEILGFSSVQKLKKGLFDINVGTEKAIALFTIDNISKILVNPRVYYKGTKIEDVKYLIGLFDSAKNQKDLKKKIKK